MLQRPLPARQALGFGQPGLSYSQRLLQAGGNQTAGAFGQGESDPAPTLQPGGAPHGHITPFVGRGWDY
jgi:hypothetical protein